MPQFPLYLRNAEVLRQPLGFSHIKNMLKDQRFKPQVNYSLTTGFSGHKSPKDFPETGSRSETINVNNFNT